MKTLNEYKEKCPAQWNWGPGYRILMVLYFEGEGGLRKDKLEELTELNNKDFSKGLSGVVEVKDIRFDEDQKGRKYFLDDGDRKAMNKIPAYNK